MSRTRSVEETLPPDAAEMFEADDPDGLASAVRRLNASPEYRKQLVQRAREVAAPLAWPRQRCAYLAVVDRLLALPSAVSARADGGSSSRRR